jgi:hypothetical protein
LAGYEEKMYPEDGRTSEPEQLTKLPWRCDLHSGRKFSTFQRRWRYQFPPKPSMQMKNTYSPLSRCVHSKSPITDVTGHIIAGWLWGWRIWWNDHWPGKLKYSKKTSTSVTLSATNPTWLWAGVNPGHCGRKPATNRLSYGTVNHKQWKWNLASVRLVLTLKTFLHEGTNRWNRKWHST